MVSKEKLQSLAMEVAWTVNEKEGQYGNVYEEYKFILAYLYPNGIAVQLFDSALAVIRVVDKLCRITRGNGEGGEDAWRDIAGYALLQMRASRQDTDPYIEKVREEMRKPPPIPPVPAQKGH